MCDLPDTVEDVAVRINPQHDVLHGRVMDEGAFRVDEEHVRNPNFLHKTCIEGATLVVAGGEGQTIVLPVMSQVQSHGEVLGTETLLLKLHQRIKRETVYKDTVNTGNTDHVHFRYAVDALHLDVNAHRDGCTCKRYNLLMDHIEATVGSHHHKASVCTSARDYIWVNPTSEL